MSLIEYAKNELTLAGYYDGDEMNKQMADGVMKLIEIFSNEGHSGFSASFASKLFYDLSRYMPLSPLTGEDNEWTECMDGLLQNKRSSRVFKQDDVAYDIDAVVFEDDNGDYYTNSESKKNITFPYYPTTKYIKENSRMNNATS